MESDKPDRKVVLVAYKKAYGREVFSPENDTARLIAELVGWKNLTIEHLKICRKLGFHVESVAPKIEGLEDD
jgi:hypothetical protein